MRWEQTRRHMQSNASAHVYKLVVDAADRGTNKRFYDVINVFLGWDEETILARARVAGFLEFDWILLSALILRRLYSILYYTVYFLTAVKHALNFLLPHATVV